MPYITIDYYLDDFIGTETADTRVIQKAINRASEVIDVLTHYQMANTSAAGYKAFFRSIAICTISGPKSSSCIG